MVCGPLATTAGHAVTSTPRRPARTRRRTLLGAAALAGLTTRVGEVHGKDAEGALVPDPDGLLDLREGFRYQVLQRVGAPMTDGYRVPGRPDAMACFALPDGRLSLMRNHELAGDAAASAWGPGGSPPKAAYDARGTGGVTRLVLDPQTAKPLSSNLVLAGTELNCAGGVSPWGFLSCEETFNAKHGYVFLCDPEAASVQPPRRIPSYGHFRHEAALADPKTAIAYMTEDEMDSSLYRFVPKHPSSPFVGKLQALRVVGAPSADTAPFATGTAHAVDWIDLPVTPEGDTADGRPIRQVARALGAARFVRGEGMWLDGRILFFTATQGGPTGRGQIFALELAQGMPTAQDRLRVVVSPSSPAELDMPDNLTVAPGGNLLVAEDGPNGNRLMVCTPAAEVFALGRNVRSTGEFAGVCFSPDQRFAFVNLQDDGYTLAIEGPFDQLAPPMDAGVRPQDTALLPPGLLGLAGGATALALAALARRRRRAKSAATSAAKSLEKSVTRQDG